MDFTINGRDYKASQLNAIQQFHIVRRVAPVLSGMVGMENNVDALGKIAEAIGGLSDTDANYVIFGLLGCVERKNDSGLGWAKVSVGESLMFQEITFADMLQLAYKAFEANFSGFLGGLGSILKDANPKQSDQ